MDGWKERRRVRIWENMTKPTLPEAPVVRLEEPEGKQITISTDLYWKLEKVASRQGLTVLELIAFACKQEIDRRKKEQALLRCKPKQGAN